ncbi:GDP-mannose 4,6-dehydratase [bacterium]|nr:GDP-mannose 4,6-dehydratase [bacterium]
MAKVLVTGGAGFIGSHLVDRLLAEGFEVKILDLLTKPVHLKGKPAYIPKEAEFIFGDVRDKTTLEYALEGVDFVYHLAAYQDYLPDFSTFFHTNVVSTALIYEIIVEKNLPVQKVIVASSQMAAGEGTYTCEEHGVFQPQIRPVSQLEKGDWEHHCPVCGKVAKNLPNPETFVNPPNPYGMSKFGQEQMAITLGKRYGISSVAMRFSIVQGPRQSFYNAYSGACRIFCLSLFFDRQPTAYEDGLAVRDYVNIEDVVEANFLVLKDKRADYEVFNVGGGKGYTVLEFGKIVSDVFGKNILPKVPNEFRFGDTRHQISDITKLKKLGWLPKHSPEKSVRDYLAYLNAQTDIEDIMDYAEKKMKQLNVVRSVKG